MRNPNDVVSNRAAERAQSNAAGARRVPRVSLGLPVYNASQFLRECMDSILAQTFTDFELIVCDNASTDDTVSIIEEYARRDPRIALHRAPVNRGAAANFNWTFELARGELFKWCAGDDILDKHYLERCVDALDKNPDATLAYSGAIDIDESSKRTKPIYDNHVPLRFAAPEPQVRYQDLICQDHSCIAVFGLAPRAVMTKTSLIGGYVGSDRTVLAELGLRGRLLRVGDDLLLHREHRGRSVNDIKDLRRRVVWFDARARGPSFPFWRLFRGYFTAITRSELPLMKQARCFVELARWVKWGAWRQLVDDLAYYLRPAPK